MWKGDKIGDVMSSLCLIFIIGNRFSRKLKNWGLYCLKKINSMYFEGYCFV